MISSEKPVSSLRDHGLGHNGSGALAGSSLHLDPEAIAEELGFDSATDNSLDGTASRDFAAEAAYVLAQIAIDVSRFAEEIIAWSTPEFGYVTLHDAWSTGSSIMPQKKNPDVPELVRGKSGRVFGHLMALLTLMKGQPLAYNKDNQEDKEPLFDAVDTTKACVQILTGVLSTMSIHATKMRAALTTDMLATDLADYLVRKGIPFRETHHISGSAVKLAEDRKCELSDLTLSELRTLHPAFEDDVKLVWDPEQSVERRNAIGGTSRRAVHEQVQKLLAHLP